MGCRERERTFKIIELEALRAIAHAELNAEIHPKTDEQHRERDRYEVERPNHQEAERCRDGKPTTRLTKTARMILPDLSASQRITSTMTTVPMPLTTIPS